MKYTLEGQDGNAIAIISYVGRAMNECGRTVEEKAKYADDATSGDYEHLLSVSQDMLDKLNAEQEGGGL